MFLFFFVSTAERGRLISYDATLIFGFIFQAAAAGTLVKTLCCSCCCGSDRVMPPRVALQRAWLALRLLLVACTPLCMTTFSVRAPRDPKWAEDPDTVWSLIWGLSCLAVGIFATPRNRGRLIQFLSSRGAAGSKEGEAAAVSALVGGGSAADALAKGASRFRALPLSRLSAEDLTTNQDTGLYEKTAEASLGAVSGFVSHSWSDDGAAKHTQLLAWGHEARRGEGLKDPLIWLDKACIKQDQSPEEKQADINALPVFLSGCRSLVVLAGPTYASRLWCRPPPATPRASTPAPTSRRAPALGASSSYLCSSRWAVRKSGSASWSWAASTSASRSTASTRDGRSASWWRTRRSSWR